MNLASFGLGRIGAVPDRHQVISHGVRKINGVALQSAMPTTPDRPGGRSISCSCRA